LGAVWDFMGNGRSRLFTHWGRFYENIPLDLADRGFGGEGIRITRYADGTGVNANKKCRTADGTPIDDPKLVTDPRTQCEELSNNKLGGKDTLIAPGLQGQYSEELIVGAEAELLPSWVFGVTGTHRYLGRVIEDLSTDGGETYMLANPGSFDNNKIQDLDAQIARAKSSTKRERLLALRNTAGGISGFPQPRRDFWSVLFSVNKQLSRRITVRGTYLLSWTKGNYPGLFSSSTGQLDPNITALYDLPSLMVNTNGYLPADQRHRLMLNGYYQVQLQEIGLAKIPVLATLGVSARAASGSPINALGADPIYQLDEVYMIERGRAGRTPWTWAVDLHVGAKYELTPQQGLEFFVDLFNVTANRGVTSVDERYTSDEVRPIVAGKMKDLPYAKTTTGAPVRVNPNFKKPTGRQSPFGGQLGARFFF
jgi:hypothetical protein